MIQYLIKLILSAAIIVVVSEVAKRSTLIAATVASLPLVTILSLIWLYIDTKDLEKISELSMSIFWLVIPSLSFLLILPQLLKYQLNFFLSIALSSAAMVVIYFATIAGLRKLGISL